MTWNTDNSGTRWVEIPQKTRRKAPRALRFGNVKVDDQLMLKPKAGWYRQIATYYVVTDLWFDPVAGQNDPLKGHMVGYAQIWPDGSPGKKYATTVRGLAAQQFEYADQDYLAMCQARTDAVETGKVIGIGKGQQIRARPKLPGL